MIQSRKRLWLLTLTLALASVLAVTTAVSVSAADSQAAVLAEGTCGDALTWTLSKNGDLVISGSGDMRDFTYTDAAPWAEYRTSINTLTVKEGVTRIGSYAFAPAMVNRGYTFDHALVLPEGVTSIGEFAFRDTVFHHHQAAEGYSLVLPDSITSIEYGAFSGVEFDGGLVLPKNLDRIGQTAFTRSDFRGTVVIPKSTRTVEPYAFSFMTGIDAFSVEEGSPSFLAQDGILYTADGSLLIQCPAGKQAKDLSLPSSVRTIEAGAFHGCERITGTLDLSEGVEEIQNNAFYLSGPSKVLVPASVTSVGQYAFHFCALLSDAYFYGDAPEYAGTYGDMSTVFAECAAGFTIHYAEGREGWSTPEWNGYPCVPFEPEDAFERGDVNGDTRVNSDDAIYLLRHTLNGNRYPINQSGDMDGDGDTDSDDAIYLLRYTLNPNRYPLA